MKRMCDVVALAAHRVSSTLSSIGRRTGARLCTFVVEHRYLAILALFLVASMSLGSGCVIAEVEWPDGQKTVLTTEGCSEIPPSSGGNMPQIKALDSNGALGVYLEMDIAGIFTPTAQANSLALDVGRTRLASRMLDDLAARGFVAVRVPHAPPSYTQSTILPGIPPYEPRMLQFSYYSPPSAATPTSIPVTLTRRTELEPLINARYPIADGKSHWEVWWLPAGDRFPIPQAPFQLGPKVGGHPNTFRLRFRIDYGAGAGAAACAGCRLEAVGYTGYTYVKLFNQPIYVETSPLPHNSPPFSFTPLLCREIAAVNVVTPSQRITFTQWLENFVPATRPFTISASSSAGWDYTYYYRVGTSGALMPAPGQPFTVTAPAAASAYSPGCLGIVAVYTTPLNMPLALGETLAITATSRLTPTLSETTYAWAFGPEYSLGGGATTLYLPIIISNYGQ